MEAAMRKLVAGPSCCWLFVAGAMNLIWIAALTAVVLAEKLLPGNLWMTRGLGVCLVAAAVAIMWRPWLT